MLPDDAKERKQAANEKSSQSTVTDHFKLEIEADKLIVYSDKAFASAAIEWLVDADLVSPDFCLPYLCTDFSTCLQPLRVFTRPSFKRMVDIASHANRGVKLPSLRQTHGHIIRSFKQQMVVLKDRLNVSLFSHPFCANSLPR